MIKSILVLIFSLCTNSIVSAHDPQDPTVNNLLKEKANECQAIENGQFSFDEYAISPVDLDRDGKNDYIVDERGFKCTSSPAIYCGAGSICPIHAIVKGKTGSWGGRDWRTYDWLDTTLLLLNIHGSECGGDNTTLCYRAIVWNGNGFSTIKDQIAE